jgi:hypothetical protein
LVRDFLISGEKEEKYGYYCYLLFYSNNYLTYEQRITAANAFMCNFWDANKADVRLEDSKNLAVFYAPIEKSENLNSLRESLLGEDLLDAYNYYSAQKIINKLADKYDIDKLEVSIVASPVPLGTLESKPDYNVVQVISLVDMPPPHIAKIICELRKNITHPAELKKVGNFFIPVLIDEDTGVDLSLKLRRFLGAIGKLVTTIGQDAHAQDFLCK